MPRGDLPSSPSDKRRARALVAKTGVPYHEALNKVRGATRRPAGDGAPDVFDPTPDPDLGGLTWRQLRDGIAAANLRLEAEGRDGDPYAIAAALGQRALLLSRLAVQTTDHIYAGACTAASLSDQREAARVRVRNHIPTLRPATDGAVFEVCDWCGRPWQDSPAGACPHCPTVLFGVTPHSQAEAATMPPGKPVDQALRGYEPQDD